MKVKASYENPRKSYEEKSASYGYQPDQFAYHSLRGARRKARRRSLRPTHHTQPQLRIERAAETRTQHLIRVAALHRKERFVHAAGLHQPEAERTRTRTPNRNVGYLREQRNETLMAVLRPQRPRHGDAARRFVGALARQESIFQHLRQRELSAHTHRRDFFSDTDERNVANSTPTTADPANTMRNLTHKWKNELAVKSTITPVKALMIMPKFRWNINREKGRLPLRNARHQPCAQAAATSRQYSRSGR